MQSPKDKKDQKDQKKNKYDENEIRRLCIDARYWEIMANKFNDKLNDAYKDC